MAGQANSLKVVIAALAGNLLIAISKFVAAFVTGSAGTLAEAVHSVADTGNQVLLLLGMRLSERGPTEEHPFGRSMEKYFWPFVVSIMLFTVGGAFAIYEGVHKLHSLHSGAPASEGSNFWSYVVLGAAFLFESYSFAVATSEFRKMKGSRTIMQTMKAAKDPTIPVVVMEDAAALFGLLIALLGLGLSDLTGWSGWDGVASLVIGALLCVVAYFLGRETHSLIVGESALPEERQRARELTLATPGVVQVRQLLTLHLGPAEVLLALKVQFQAGLPVEKVEEAVEAIEVNVRAELPHMRYIFVEPDSRYEAPKDARAVPS